VEQAVSVRAASGRVGDCSDARRNMNIVLYITIGSTGWSIRVDLGPVKLSFR
jgi:hypothetical protein